MVSVFTLDISGTLIAAAFGILIIIFGGNLWWFFMAVMIDFLVLSAIATRARDEEKVHLRGYEKLRSWKNVVANGLVPVIIVIFYFFNSVYFALPQIVVLYAFVASVCAITADKFASEFGVLAGDPVFLLTLKKTKKGRSGAVTWFGTLMGVVASALIGLTIFAVGGSIVAYIALIFSGVVGNLVDSVFGYFEERGMGNKYTTNLLCSVAGALFFIILALGFKIV
jgi:uncharacterized protein (TIGR00297 family)